MKLPNGDRAIVEEEKLRAYLLSPRHPVGRFKAAFFAAAGFGPERWRDLRSWLLELAKLGDAHLSGETRFGRKFLIHGDLVGATGAPIGVTTVWIIRAGEDAPRLVTVYPR